MRRLTATPPEQRRPAKTPPRVILTGNPDRATRTVTPPKPSLLGPQPGETTHERYVRIRTGIMALADGTRTQAQVAAIVGCDAQAVRYHARVLARSGCNIRWTPK